MGKRLEGCRIAVLLSDGFEQVELTEPMKALREQGAMVHLVSPNKTTVQGHNHRDQADKFPVDTPLDQARPDDYQALFIPGGLFSPDALRINDRALGFVRAFFESGKPVAAICHGPQVLINAGTVKGRRMTGYKAIQKDLANAGASVSDEPVVVDQGLVTSRNPDDIPAFNGKMIEEFAEGRHRGQHAAASA